jgi:predicted GNAT superfamily acetyltransferase
MEYHILATVNKDLPRVVDINQDALPGVSSITLNDLTQFLEMADYFRVIKVKNDIAGFLIALTPGKDYQSPNYKWFKKYYSQFMYVDRIVIDPSFQSRGLGRAFYDDLKIFCQGYAPIITCEVNLKPKNDGSLIFHKKYGFEQVGTQETEGGKKEVSLMVYKIPVNR